MFIKHIIRRNRLLSVPFLTIENDGKLSDLSGYGLHGTITGAGWTANHNSISNRALEFTGATHKVNFGDVNLDTFYGASGYGTICIGFKYKAESRERYLICKYTSNAELLLYLNSANNALVVNIYSTTNSDYLNKLIPIANFTDGNWYYLVVLYDLSQTVNNRIRLYLNDVEKVSSITANGTFVGMVNKADNLLLGSDGTKYYGSSIDHLSIHNAVLTRSELTNKYMEYR